MANLLQSLSISASGLAAQAERLNIISQNIANADTPGYQRKQISFIQAFSEVGLDAVEVDQISLDTSDFKRIHSPSHPLANEQGYYEGSNVNLLVEVADSRQAQRSYEANLRSFDISRQMSQSLIDILKR